MDSFEQKKASILKEISLNSEDNKDASPKGTIDVRCLPIIETINNHLDLVTTSLCSGRVAIFLEGEKVNNQIGAKGNGGHWLFVTHDPETLDNWYKTLNFKHDLPPVAENSIRYILFKFEPLVLHVKCRDAETARLLLTTAVGCGFRDSGINVNNIVSIKISIKLDLPVGYLHGEEHVAIVPEQYLEFLTQLSHERFRANFRKMDQLREAISTMGRVSDFRKESKEARRERLIAEGMARRDTVRAEKERKREEKRKQEEEKLRVLSEKKSSEIDTPQN